MFEISKVHDVSVLHLYGEISLLEMDLIQKIIDSFKRYRHHKVLLDLARVDHVHFQAVKTWARAALDLRTLSGDLKLLHTNKDTQNMLKFTGADQYLCDYSSMGEAILSFLGAPWPHPDSVISKKDFDQDEDLDQVSDRQRKKNPEILAH